jgi:MoxR-like ATPase
MKSQRFVYLLAVRELNGNILLQDSTGALFDVPIINEFGSKEYKRAVAAANSPERFCIKARCKGTLGNGELTFGKYPAAKYTDCNVVKNFNSPDGGLDQYRVVTDVPESVAESVALTTTAPAEADVLGFIHNESCGLKPKMLFIDDLKWKYLIRNIIRGKNIMMTGPAGSGKTMAAKAAAGAMEGYNMEIFNLGSTQDPRATLIGNTQFESKTGTVFNESPFVKAIQVENTVIVLDELSRAHPEAHNILMSVLDEGQRYLRLDEAPNSPIVKVAKGVSFIASANIGNEYTATRQIDKALRDRFTVIEMETLTADEETSLLKMMYPTVAEKSLAAVAEITSMTRNESKKETAKVTNGLSTRTAVEIGSLLYDGFTLEEAAQITIYPEFEDEGGADVSERVYVKQFVQKFIDNDENDDLFPEANEADQQGNVNNPF